MVPFLRHNYHDQNSGLTEIYLGFAIPILIVNLMTRSRYTHKYWDAKANGNRGAWRHERRRTNDTIRNVYTDHPATFVIKTIDNVVRLKWDEGGGGVTDWVDIATSEWLATLLG